MTNDKFKQILRDEFNTTKDSSIAQYITSTFFENEKQEDLLDAPEDFRQILTSPLATEYRDYHGPCVGPERRVNACIPWQGGY